MTGCRRGFAPPLPCTRMCEGRQPLSRAQQPSCRVPPSSQAAYCFFNFSFLRRYWTDLEHTRFLEALQAVGPKDFKGIAQIVGTRNATQARTHAQKYFLKLARMKKGAEEALLANGIPGTIQESWLQHVSMAFAKSVESSKRAKSSDASTTSRTVPRCPSIFLKHNRMPACFLGTRSVACLTDRLGACLDACARSPPQKVARRRRCVTFHQIVAQRRQSTRGTGRRVAAATRARAHRVVMGVGHRLGDQEVQSEKISSHPLIRSLPPCSVHPQQDGEIPSSSAEARCPQCSAPRTPLIPVLSVFFGGLGCSHITAPRGAIDPCRDLI